MLLVIDNYDSFTYNLVQYFGALGIDQRVFRNDKISVQEALLRYDLHRFLFLRDPVLQMKLATAYL